MTTRRLPAPPRPRGLAGRVFLDSERRLRLGWRLLSYLALVVVATGGVAAMIAGSDPPVGRNLLAHLVAVALVVAITWLFRRPVDRRSWRDLGLPPPGRAQLAASGAGFALGVLTIVGFFGVLRALGWVRVDGGEVAERGVAGVVALLAAGLGMYAASALFQELAFRGYFFQNLAERLPTGSAAIVAGLIFAALHLPGEDFSSLPLTLVLVADLTLMACFLTLTRLATGSLWLAIGFHTAWNWTMDYVFSLDTAAGPDYGDALVHTRVGGPDLFGGRYGGVELLYALTSALLLTAYWRFIRRRRVAGPREHTHRLDTSTP
jgi:uncharacterized protein